LIGLNKIDVLDLNCVINFLEFSKNFSKTCFQSSNIYVFFKFFKGLNNVFGIVVVNKSELINNLQSLDSSILQILYFVVYKLYHLFCTLELFSYEFRGI